MPSEQQSLLHQHHSSLPHPFAKHPYSSFAYRAMATHHLKEELDEAHESRSSSRASSIIDPGDEIDKHDDEGPSLKKMCFERAGSKSPASDKGKNKGFLIKDILDNAAAAASIAQPNPIVAPNPMLASSAFMRPWSGADSTEAAAAMAAANAHSYLSQLSLFQNALHQYQTLAGLQPSLSHLFGSVVPPVPPTSAPTAPFTAASLPVHHPALIGSLPSPSLMSSQAAAAAAAAAAYRLLPNRRPRSADDDSRSERSESDSPVSVNASSSNATITSGNGASSSNTSSGASNNNLNNNNSSPLDALFEMTSKAFERNDPSDKNSGQFKFYSFFPIFHYVFFLLFRTKLIQISLTFVVSFFVFTISQTHR